MEFILDESAFGHKPNPNLSVVSVVDIPPTERRNPSLFQAHGAVAHTRTPRREVSDVVYLVEDSYKSHTLRIIPDIALDA